MIRYSWKVSAVLFVLSAGAAAHAAQPNPSDLDTIREVMLGYFAAFPRDARAAADYMGEPQLVVQHDKLLVLTRQAEIASRLTSQLAQLWVRGYSSTKQPELHIKTLSATTALCGAVEIRVKEDGTELERIGYTYLLQKEDKVWKIHAIISTDLDKTIASD